VVIISKYFTASNAGKAASTSIRITTEGEQSSKKIAPRIRVVIGCVTFETIKVVKPILDLRAEKVYILHKDSSEPGKPLSIYNEFFQEVVRQLHESGLKDRDIIERNVMVFRFKDVLSELVSIMTKERDDGNEVYINISAGSMEFAAAATIASMMVDGVRPFTVHTREYTISGEEAIRKAFYVGDKPVGQSSMVADPVELPTFQIDIPPMELVMALRELRRRKQGKQSTKYSLMIQAIKDAGAWTYDPEKERNMKAKDAQKGDRLLQAEKMYYSRHYIDGWIKNGWVDGKDGRGRELQITNSGINVTDIFYLDRM
jgi:hypothetical protein